MKLRVKHSKATLRIVVENDCTYEYFKETVASNLGCPPNHIKCSLNRKDEFKSATLREEGVRSGDLVWLLGDVIFSPTSGTEQSHSRSTVPTHTVPPPLIHENAEWPAGRGLKHSMHKRPMECANVDQGQPMEVETVEEPQEEARRPAWSHDDYMMHVRLANLEHTGLTCAVHSAFLEAGCRPTWKSEVSDNEDDKFQLPPRTSCVQRLRYQLKGGDTGEAVCQVVLTHMAGFLMISAKAADRPSHSLSIKGKDFEADTGGGGGACLKQRELWIQLSNTVVRPVVADCRALLGLPPPADLLGLPIEICHLIFKHLQMVDLVNLTATCKELRSLASADPLWSRLCHDDFSVDKWDEDDAGRWGWMRVYRMKHVQRELARQRIEDERRSNRRRSNTVPGLLGGPFGGRRRGPYHQIGGDYDWNPMVQPAWRPFLGGGGLGSRGGSRGGFRYASG